MFNFQHDEDKDVVLTTQIEPTAESDGILSPPLKPSRPLLTQKITALHGRFGNRAVQRMLNSQKAQSRTVQPGIGPIQPMLEVGSVTDPLEREAEQIAAEVVRLLRDDTSSGIDEDARVFHPNALGRKPSEDGQRVSRVQRAPGWSTPIGSEGGVLDTDLEGEVRSSLGSGRPLADRTLHRMAGAFGVDFSAVRIHDDARSDRFCRSIQAKAFTAGNDIFFRAGEFKPDVPNGQHTLAHELTHVVQQAGGLKRASRQSWGSGESERDSIPVLLRIRANAIASIQRDWEDSPDGEWWINLVLKLMVNKASGEVVTLEKAPVTDWAVLQNALDDFQKQSERQSDLRATSKAMKKAIKEVGNVWKEQGDELVNESRGWTLNIKTLELRTAKGVVTDAEQIGEVMQSLRDGKQGKIAKSLREKQRAAKAAEKEKEKKKGASSGKAPIPWMKVLNPDENEYVELLEWAVHECPAALIPDIDIELVEWIIGNASTRIGEFHGQGTWYGELHNRFRPLLEALRLHADLLAGKGKAARLAERNRQIEQAAVGAMVLRRKYSPLLNQIASLAKVDAGQVLGTIVWLCGDAAEGYLERLEVTRSVWNKIKGLEAHFEIMLAGGGESALRGAVPEVEVAAKQVDASNDNVTVGAKVPIGDDATQEVDVMTVDRRGTHLIEVKADVSALVVKHLVKLGKKYQLDILLSLAQRPDMRVTIDCRRATGWARLWYTGYMARLLLLWNDNTELDFIIANRSYTLKELRAINRIMLVQMELMGFDNWVKREMEMDMPEPIDLLSSVYASSRMHSATAEGVSAVRLNLKEQNRPGTRQRSSSAPPVLAKGPG